MKNMKKGKILLINILVGIFISAASQVYATNYVVTDLGFNGYPLGMNDLGQVVGWRESTDSAFLWDNGVVTDLGVLPGYESSDGVAINNNGVVVGTLYDYDEPYYRVAFIWDSGNGMSKIEETLPGGTETEATNINDLGQVVGYADGADFLVHPFQWEEGEGMIDLDFTGSNEGYADDINELGQAVGSVELEDYNTYSFIFEDGVIMTNIGLAINAYFGGEYNAAYAINNLSQVVGEADNADGDSRPFLWDNGTVTELEYSPTAQVNAAWDINDSGQIVGWAVEAIWESRAILWENGVAIDLNDYMPPEYSDWTLQYGESVNNNGQIVATGMDSLHNFRGFLLTPVIPEPASLLLLGLGVTGLMFFRKRRVENDNN